MRSNSHAPTVARNAVRFGLGVGPWMSECGFLASQSKWNGAQAFAWRARNPKNERATHSASENTGNGREVVEDWFAARGWKPFTFHQEVWAASAAGESGLIHAATGTGKAYAAWFGPLIEWMNGDGEAYPSTRVLWITPLRALVADTEQAVRAPHAFEVVEVAAARDAYVAGAIESRYTVERPLDLLAQHAVTIALGGGFREDDLFHEVRTTNAYRDLSRAEWKWVLEFISRGGEALRCYAEYQRVIEDDDGVYRVANGQVARRQLLSIGTIVADSSVDIQYLTASGSATWKRVSFQNCAPEIISSSPESRSNSFACTTWLRR